MFNVFLKKNYGIMDHFSILILNFDDNTRCLYAQFSRYFVLFTQQSISCSTSNSKQKAGPTVANREVPRHKIEKSFGLYKKTKGQVNTSIYYHWEN